MSWSPAQRSSRLAPPPAGARRGRDLINQSVADQDVECAGLALPGEPGLGLREQLLAFPMLEASQMAGPLRSTDITPLPS